MSRRCDLSSEVTLSKGNKVSKSKQRTKRWFVPNIQQCTYNSKLGRLSLSLSTSTMRTIRKYGSIEQYILKIKRKRLTAFGQNLRKKLSKLEVKQVKQS